MSDVNYQFNDRVAVVTGGRQGIGAAIAARLRDAGCRSVIWDIAEPAEKANLSDYCPVDVSDHEALEQATETTLQRHGRIDFLSHNAGLSGPTLPTVEYDVETWQQIIDVNLVGSFKTCRAVIPAMLEQGYGRVILMASLAGKEGTPNASAYSASKAGVIALTKSLGKELAQTDIRVNCIAPAAIRTSLLDQMTPQHVQIMIDKSPMGRLGEVEEAVEMVMWLCSDACTFNSGAVFDLSGGRATY